MMQTFFQYLKLKKLFLKPAFLLGCHAYSQISTGKSKGGLTHPGPLIYTLNATRQAYAMLLGIAHVIRSRHPILIGRLLKEGL